MIRSIEQRFNRLVMRERLLVVGVVVALILFITVRLFVQPLIEQQRQQQQQQRDLQTQREQLMAEVATLQARLTQKQESPEQKQLQQQLLDVEQAIQAQTQTLVPPQQMSQLLREVMQQQRGLQLIELEHKPQQSVANTAANSPIYYKHPLRFTVKGHYFEIVNYLQKLETAPWQMQWETLDYRVEQYPVAIARIEVATLSSQAAWLQ